MNDVSPRLVFQQITEAIPARFHRNLIVIGSVAAAYHFSDGPTRLVRTKDIDCLVTPRNKVSKSGAQLTNALLRDGWKHRAKGGFGSPQSSPTPNESLPGIRLQPPRNRDLFLELLAEPDSENQSGKQWTPIQLEDGYYGIPSFEFLSLASNKPHQSELGIQYARPEMMALANLLSHCSIGSATMSTKIEGRTIKRANKDLGRVLALARLSEEATDSWAADWKSALQVCFHSRCRQLAGSAGDGLRELLASADDLEEAFHTCTYGLLTGVPLTMEQLRATGERLIADAIEPLNEWDALP